MEPLELEAGFEPQIRARSNTWPLPRPEAPDAASEGAAAVGAAPAAFTQPKMFAPPPTEALGHVLGAAKKNSSRRNAWGNMSYADLITQAIQSAPENRLTLSQIYEWMVQNVLYFKDKGDSNSSAGWKVGVKIKKSDFSVCGSFAGREKGCWGCGDLLAHRGDLNARHPRPLEGLKCAFNARFFCLFYSADKGSLFLKGFKSFSIRLV